MLYLTYISYDSLGLKAQYELLPGMEVALMPHQTIGVAWMLEKERSNNKGGCLADDMGLGKVCDFILRSFVVNMI